MPIEKWERYALPMHTIVYATPGTEDYDDAIAGLAWIMQDVQEEISRRRADGVPRADLLSDLMMAEVEGAPLDDQTLLEIAYLVIVGGLDNTASLLANTFLYLHHHHDDREQLRGNLDLTHTAFDEFLRYFSVTQAESRTATRRHRGRWLPDHRGRAGAHRVGIGEPRSGGLRPARRDRARPHAEPAPRVRVGTAPVRGRRAREGDLLERAAGDAGSAPRLRGCSRARS